MADETKITLSEAEIPERWYNITVDLPSPPPPPLHPGTGQPIGPEMLAPLFPMGLILQEVSQERFIAIPDEVREVYKLWRPTPLYRARRLERALDTPAHIYYKYEGLALSEATSPIQRSLKPITTNKRGCVGSSPKRGRASGAARWLSRATCSASSARSTWCGCPTSRSPTVAR
jgi:predicted alternative tryptophan synthase beta-subunit